MPATGDVADAALGVACFLETVNGGIQNEMLFGARLVSWHGGMVRN